MDICITDACIFIDLMKYDWIGQFFKLPFTFHTTLLVINELREEQVDLLQPYIHSNRLLIDESDSISNQNYSRSLSLADVSVLVLAERTNGILVSSDNLLRKVALQKKLNVHGFVWLIEQLLHNQLILPNEAIDGLGAMLNDPYFSQNILLKNEIIRISKSISESLK
jgi:hypothetical protein